MTPSMRIAINDLGLARIAVVYPGTRRYPLADGVEVVPVTALAAAGGLFGSWPGPVRCEWWVTRRCR